MKYLFPILILVTLFSCKEEADDFTFELGREYFPLEVGKFWIYQVDSTVYDPDGTGINLLESTTFFKEEIIEKLENFDSTEVYKAERYERKNQNDPWELTRVFTLERSDRFAYRNENNIRLVSLTFPVKRTADWTATKHFDPLIIIPIAGESVQVYKDWDSEVEEVGEEETINGFDFEITSVLHENNDNNPFERRYVFEKFAKNVGLVSREMLILDSQYCNQEPVPDDCDFLTWEEKGEKGFLLTQTILDYN